MFNRLRAFLSGRYGIDQLSIALIVPALAACFAARFALYWPLTALSLVLYGLALWRMFSRNFTARRAENARFMKTVNSVRGFFMRMRARVQSRKSYRFFKCPGCKNTLRVPRGRGKIRITCPKCGERFEKKT